MKLEEIDTSATAGERASAGREVVARALESGAPATLATAKHGGCVQVGDGHALAEHITDHLCANDYDIGGRPELLACVAEAIASNTRDRFETWARLNGHTLTRSADGEYCFISVRNLWTSWQAALSAQPQYITDAYELGMRDGQNLSAQPSPGGQGDARAQFEAWAKSAGLETKIYDHNDMYSHPVTRGAWMAWQQLAARQPVGQITDTEIDARLNAMYREMVDSGQHNGGMSGVAWGRAVFRMASGQPAQAVDLGAAIKAEFPLLTDYGLHHSHCCEYKLIDERHRLHNLIDSQAVGK